MNNNSSVKKVGYWIYVNLLYLDNRFTLRLNTSWHVQFTQCSSLDDRTNYYELHTRLVVYTCSKK